MSPLPPPPSEDDFYASPSSLPMPAPPEDLYQVPPPPPVEGQSFVPKNYIEKGKLPFTFFLPIYSWIVKHFWNNRSQIGWLLPRTPPGGSSQEKWLTCRNSFQQPRPLTDVLDAVLRYGLSKRDIHQRKEMRQIFKFQTLAPREMNHDFSFTWITSMRAHFLRMPGTFSKHFITAHD